jgi:phosphatidylinositol-3-phosphatase
MVVIFENRSRGEVIGNGEWPYLNELAGRYGNTTNWASVSHPSEPNYLALISGSTQGVSSDLCEGSYSTEMLPGQLARVGLGWRAYIEGLPEPGSLLCTFGLYAKKHNPFAFFPAVNGPNVVPAGEGASALKTDLANGTAPPFIWLTPNLCNDVHDCSNETGDNYLRALVPGILASKWYGEGGTVILTFDEDTGENKIATLVLHGAGAHRTLDAAGSHCGTLATIEDAYRLPRLGCAQGAATLAPLIEEAPPSLSP